MSSTDNRIVSDLAIVGRTSRERPRSLEHTLRQLESPPRDAAPNAMSALYAARVARVWSGVVLLIGIVAHYPFFGSAHFTPGKMVTFHASLLSAFELGAVLGAFAAATYVGVRILLRRRPVTRETFDRLDRWSVAMTVAAPLTFALFIGYLRILIGDLELYVLYADMETYEDDGQKTVIVIMGIAIVASVLVGVVASRFLGARPRVWVGVVGVLGAAVTSYLAWDYEHGAIMYGLWRRYTYQMELRVALLVMAGVSLGAVLVTAAQALRRRELRALDQLST